MAPTPGVQVNQNVGKSEGEYGQESLSLTEGECEGPGEERV